MGWCLRTTGRFLATGPELRTGNYPGTIFHVQETSGVWWKIADCRRFLSRSNFLCGFPEPGLIVTEAVRLDMDILAVDPGRDRHVEVMGHET